MKFYLKVLCLFTVTLCFTQLRAQTTPKIWGINGHPLTQEAYRANLEEQITLLKALQAKYYRIDLTVNKEGVIKQAGFSKVASACKAINVQLLPVIVFNAEDVSVLASTAYTDGYAIGKGFEKRYHSYFSNYEVGNELDNVLIKPNYEGARTVDYDDISKIERYMAYLKGITAGIKSSGRKSTIIINMSFVHSGFIALLNTYNAKFDAIGLHWYSDMGDLNNVAGNRGDILKSLTTTFKKPIWLTEFNVRNGSLNKNIDPDYLSRNLNIVKSTSNVKACFLYELLDEPAFERNPNLPNNQHTEAHYGLVDKLKSKKNVFYQYNKILKAKK